MTSEERFMPKHDRFRAYFETLVNKLGGFFNAHAHIDRANTYEFSNLNNKISNKGFSTPLIQKQSNTGELHKSKHYERDNLEERMREVLDDSIFFNVKRVDSAIDTTADFEKIFGDRFRALEVALALKEEYAGRIDFRVGSYPIFGFKSSEPERWKVFKEASKMADFIVGLPERDDREGHVGYRVHVKRLLNASLACDKPKPVHIHVDQGNIPSENGTELVLGVLDTFRDEFPSSIDGEPSVWLVHMISPSCYAEERYIKLVKGLLEFNVGVIVCPSAAISMMQKREFEAPLHNSIARVTELLVAGVPVRIGTDNINDMFIPSGSPDLYYEVFGLTHAVRYYTPEVLAELTKVAAGVKLNDTERFNVFESLDERVKTYYRQFLEKVFS